MVPTKFCEFKGTICRKKLGKLSFTFGKLSFGKLSFGKLSLTLASKVIEKVISLQIKRFLDKHAVIDEHQSAYRKYYSTETALLDLTSIRVSKYFV